MAEQRTALVPGFTWSVEAGRYRSASTGRYVPPAQVRAALDRVLDGSSGRMRALATRLQAGEIGVAEWQRSMATELRAAHVAAASSAKGGFAQMSQADYGFVGQRVRTQLGYLQRFADQVARGQQPLNGTLLARAELYGQAARGSAREMERREAQRGGWTHERNELAGADHCAGCLAATARGVVPIGTLPAVGSRDCKARCRCVLRPERDPALRPAERAA